MGILLVSASVVAGLLYRRPQEKPLPRAADLVACHRDVRGLLVELGTTSAKLQEEAVTGEAQDVSARWRRFARGWQDDWNEVNERCRFDEMADTGQNVAYELLANVHRDLIAVKASYVEMMERFGRDQVDDLARLREALDRSRADLERAPP